jgi:hypothetical protein
MVSEKFYRILYFIYIKGMINNLIGIFELARGRGIKLVAKKWPQA